MNRSIRNVGRSLYAGVTLTALRSVVMLSAALLLFWGLSVNAQTFRGKILGTVTDSSGASIAGATVTVKNTATGFVRTVATGEDGAYNLPELPIGSYSATVEKSGFKTSVVSGVAVEVAKDSRTDVTLQAGEVAQTVEVSGETLPQVESTSDTLGGIIESKVVTSLPVNGRDYQKLIFLVPGVTGSPDQITEAPGSFGIFSINGARGRSNNFLLDGTDMNDGYRNDPAINEAGVYGTPATILPIEGIAELHVASNFEAEYGRSAGGVVNVVTKSGTNQFHGSAFEFFRNTGLNARNYFNPVGQPKQPFSNNQFGGSLGGPIAKDNTFFFVDYEGLRESGGQNYFARVPTAQEVQLATADLVAMGGTLNSVIANLLALNPWPTANITGLAPFDSSNNVFVNTPFSNYVNSVIAKIDHNFKKDSLLTGRYYFGDSTQSFPLGLVGGSLLPGYNINTPTRVQLVSISYVSSITPSMVNESRLGWNRFAEGFFPQDQSFDPNTTIGLNTVGPGTPNNNNPYNFGLPRINVGGYAQIGANFTTPRQRVDTNWHFIDGVSWTAGKNSIKFGYEFRRTSISQIFNEGFRGRLSFNGSDLRSSLVQFLSGVPAGTSLNYSGNSNRNTFENSQSAYFQDSLRLRRNVTLVLGLRYDYNGLIQDKQGNFTNVDLTTGQPFLLGPKRLYQPDYNNFSPRVSVAWDVTGKGKTVVRAGYGIFTDAYSQDNFMGQAPYNSFFDPGANYSSVGPNPIFSARALKVAIQPNVSVWGPSSGMPDAFGVDPHIRTPYMENYNLNLQQQFGSKMVLQVGYVGSQGHKLFDTRDINQPTLSEIQQFYYGDPANGSDCYCTPRHIPFTNVVASPYYLNYLETAANSTYNSLQASYSINGWHGLTSTLNYTWSHSIDTASDGWDYVPNVSQPDNSQQPKLNRGNSNFDVRNRLAWNFIYQFPTFGGSWQKLKNGWGLNGILTLQSGQPFHFNYNFEADYNGTGEGFARPDIVGPIVYNQHDPNNFLDLTSFAVPCTLQGGTSSENCQLVTPGTTTPCLVQAISPTCINSMHFGTLGRNSLVGPHFRQFDFSVYKNTAITERLSVELRFEAYNLFNHPNFANPYLPLFIADPAQQGISDGTGSIPIGRGAGKYQLTSTGDVGIGYPFLGSGGPRGLQLAAKFTF